MLENRLNRFIKLLQLDAPPIVLAHEFVMLEEVFKALHSDEYFEVLKTTTIRKIKQRREFCTEPGCGERVENDGQCRLHYLRDVAQEDQWDASAEEWNHLEDEEDDEETI